jgi:hypothetical protein
MESGSAKRRNIRKEDARYKPYVLKRLTDDEPYEKGERGAAFYFPAGSGDGRRKPE